MFDKQVKILNISTFSFIGITALIFVFNSTRQCIENRYEIKITDFVLGGLIYMSISFAFLIAGLLMLKTIKDHYENFYGDYGKWIWIMTFALSIPMFLRSINLFMMSQPWNYDLYLTHYTTMIAIYVFVFNVLPFVMQMCILSFGVLKLYKKK